VVRKRIAGRKRAIRAYQSMVRKRTGRKTAIRAYQSVCGIEESNQRIPSIQKDFFTRLFGEALTAAQYCCRNNSELHALEGDRVIRRAGGLP